MRTMVLFAALAMSFCFPAPAQNWEVGADAGYGFSRDLRVTAPAATAETGFKSGVAFGAVAGNDMYRYVGGEARYTYRQSDMKLSSAGTSTEFAAESHAVHFDLTLHSKPRGAALRPFLAAGAGAKWYRGTGAERSFQPLSNILVLSHATEAKPLVTFGGGVKAKISQHALVRVEFRDYATPVPEKLLVPRRDVSVGGWVHDFIFLLGVSASF